MSRRRFLGAASVTGLAAVASSAPVSGVPVSGSVPPPAARVFTAATGGSVTLSPAGDHFIAEVQGILWRIPRSGGTAVALTRWDLEPTRPVHSPDGSRVALCAYQGGGFSLWSMRPDGTGLRRLTDGPWDDRGVAWSPDGTRLVFSSERGADATAGGTCGIWMLALDGGRLTRLTGGPFEDYDPVWTPDGRAVVFVRAAAAEGGGTDGGLSLARVPADGGEVTVLHTVTEGRLLCPSVSPTGRVAHLHLTGTLDSASRPAGGAALVVDGTVVADTDDPAAAPPRWDGPERLVYLAGGRIRIRTLSPPSVEDVPFTARHSNPAADPAAGSEPGSAPDDAGSATGFASGGAASAPVLRRARRRPASMATPGPVRSVHQPVLSPDGGRVAFIALNALWLMPVGGSPRRIVRGGPGHLVQSPAWTADGRALLYCSDRDGLPAVRRRDLDGGGDVLVAAGGRLRPAVSPVGDRVACLDTAGNLLLHDPATGSSRVLATPMADGWPPGAPSWSPDGRYLAWCDRNRLNRRFREGYNLIRVLDTVTGAESRHLPAEHQSLSDRCSSGPAWSPDGRWMALVLESALWVLPVAPDGTPAGPPRRITDDPADHPGWAGDSRTLLHLSGGRLCLTDRETGTSRTVAVPLTARRGAPRRDSVCVHAGQVWDGISDAPRQDLDIGISGGRITSVEPHRPGRPAGRTMDLSDHTVIPGLFDSHTHPTPSTYGARQNLLALAYGVTTTASMGGSLHEAVTLRESLAFGHCVGPRLLACAEMIDGARVAYATNRAHRTRAGVLRTLRRITELDMDFVKTYVRAPGWVMARAAETAHRLGVPCGGHLCSPGRDAGQDLTTHLQATQRLEYGHATTPLGRVHQDLVEQYADGGFALIATPFTALPLLGADPSLADDPRVTALMPPWDVATVREVAAAAPTARQARDLAVEMDAYRRLVTHGAVLALGTDAPLVPVGLHLHLAMRALRAHGFTTAEVLRTVTTVPARLFGLGADLGTVEAGRIADLTVVDGDPFTDFATLVRTPMVFQSGVARRQADLLAGLPVVRHTPEEHAAWLGVARRLRHSPSSKGPEGR